MTDEAIHIAEVQTDPEQKVIVIQGSWRLTKLDRDEDTTSLVLEKM